jgi:hypothetical protein
VKANRLVLLAVAGAMLALTGCTQSGNVAARVGDTTVPTSEVDFLTRIQCASLDKAAEDPQQGQPAQTVATSQIRVGMVNTLVEAELNRQLAEREELTYDRATLRNVMSQFEATVDQVPGADQDRFREIVEGVYRGQLQVYALAEYNLSTEGVDDPGQDELAQAVARIQDDFRKSVDVEINPEYGADADGVAGTVDPSLSLAVSSFAKQGRATQPEPDWVAALPADQRCG